MQNVISSARIVCCMHAPPHSLLAIVVIATLKKVWEMISFCGTTLLLVNVLDAFWQCQIQFKKIDANRKRKLMDKR